MTERQKDRRTKRQKDRRTKRQKERRTKRQKDNLYLYDLFILIFWTDKGSRKQNKREIFSRGRQLRRSSFR
jgi:hypothetical protein